MAGVSAEVGDVGGLTRTSGNREVSNVCLRWCYSDIDIYRTGNALIHEHREGASYYAARSVSSKSSTGSRSTWPRPQTVSM
jgi:hypothetical protein